MRRARSWTWTEDEEEVAFAADSDLRTFHMNMNDGHILNIIKKDPTKLEHYQGSDVFMKVVSNISTANVVQFKVKPVE